MGVKSLGVFLKKTAPLAFQRVQLSDFSGKRIAIDSNNLVKMLGYVATKSIVDMTDLYHYDVSHNRIKNELTQLILNFCHKFYKNEITPVFVFDGKPPEEKANAKEKRKQEQEKTLERYTDIITKIRGMPSRFSIPSDDIKLAKSLLNRISPVDHVYFSEIKELIRNFGFPVIQSNGEGEKLCAMFAREGLVSAVWSSDSDNWMYGCPKTIRNCSDSSTGSAYDLIDYETILQELKMSPSEFQQFCILCGTDYNENIPGIGPAKAYTLISKHKNIMDIPLSSFKSMSKKFTTMDCLNYEPTFILTSPCDSSLLYDNNSQSLDYSKNTFYDNRKGILDSHPNLSIFYTSFDRLNKDK